MKKPKIIKLYFNLTNRGGVLAGATSVILPSGENKKEYIERTGLGLIQHMQEKTGQYIYAALLSESPIYVCYPGFEMNSSLDPDIGDSDISWEKSRNGHEYKVFYVDSINMMVGEGEIYIEDKNGDGVTLSIQRELLVELTDPFDNTSVRIMSGSQLGMYCALGYFIRRVAYEIKE